MKKNSEFFSPFGFVMLFAMSAFGVYNIFFLHSKVAIIQSNPAGLVLILGLFLAHLVYYCNRILQASDLPEKVQLRSFVAILLIVGGILANGAGIGALFFSVFIFSVLVYCTVYSLNLLGQRGPGLSVNNSIGSISASKLQALPFWIIAVTMTSLFVLLGVCWQF